MGSVASSQFQLGLILIQYTNRGSRAAAG